MSKRARVRAPELQGRSWINTGGKELSLADFRGRTLVLDFWTFCCVNCLHVLDELRELEEKHRDTLVIIGVHSPKFVHEAEHQAVVDAVERYEVHHPVLDDPELATWKQYAVRAWPTLVVVDPEGYVVAQHAGEGHAHAIEKLVEELEAEHAAKGTLRRGDGPYVAPEPVATHLRFPGKALLLDDGGFLVSDTTRHRLVELDADGETVRRHFGTGDRGFTDGGPEEVRFSEPQGLTVLPDGRIAVADTVNHAIRALDLTTGATTTLAGTGRQWWQGAPTSGAGREVDLSSPWDVAWFDGRLWIAMAGVHQLWTYDAEDGTVRVAAGTTNEGLVDGPGAEPGSPSRPGSPPPRTGSGSRTRRRPHCATSTWRAPSTPPSAPGSSTSATATGPLSRRCSSTRWASPRCPTDRSPSATRTTTPCAATTRRAVRSARSPRICASPATPCWWTAISWSSSPPGTG